MFINPFLKLFFELKNKKTQRTHLDSNVFVIKTTKKIIKILNSKDKGSYELVHVFRKLLDSLQH